MACEMAIDSMKLMMFFNESQIKSQVLKAHREDPLRDVADVLHAVALTQRRALPDQEDAHNATQKGP
eukprot:CAMPEP_0115540094 /NCGR_PEP_ID=MMETSP0271-20121206/89749_1 /TAXON_ID=71861 /ORGANISM="Scrippsiella trochoidea, Strain CCMP3099" /LENGTH=66 /DNA_ID=CAMNT_0002973075 /DNA_START=673 /DNA_END=873 /DNA_ORIENTATION=-